MKYRSHISKKTKCSLWTRSYLLYYKDFPRDGFRNIPQRISKSRINTNFCPIFLGSTVKTYLDLDTLGKI